MGKMEQTLKSEIIRLARKEMRATYLPLSRDVRQLKRSVSALRKTVAVLAKLRAELQAQRTAERHLLTGRVYIAHSGRIGGGPRTAQWREQPAGRPGAPGGAARRGVIGHVAAPARHR